MGKKYHLIANGCNYRIRAIKDFGRVKEGQIGGIVCGEQNLSQDGTCWIDFDSSVTDNASVWGNAQVTKGSRLIGNARVYGDASIKCSTLSDFVEIYDNAIIDHSTVSVKSRVYGNAVVKLAELSGYPKIYESAVIEGSKTENVVIKDLAKIHNNSVVINGSIVGGATEIYGYAVIDHSIMCNTVRVGGNSALSYCTLKDNVSVDGSTKLRYVDVDGKAHITDGFVDATNSIVVMSGLPMGKVTIYTGVRNKKLCVLTNSSAGVKTFPEFYSYFKKRNIDTSVLGCLSNCANVVLENATRK